MPPRVAILGWGSLLWEGGSAFDKWHDDWRCDGPILNLEFSRVSASRLGNGPRRLWRFLLSELDWWMRNRVDSPCRPCSPNRRES